MIRNKPSTLLPGPIMKGLIGLSLVAPLYAQYNVIKDKTFEDNNPVWVVGASDLTASADHYYYDEHAPCGQHVAALDAWTFPDANPGYAHICYLKQDLVRRTAWDYNMANNLNFLINVSEPKTDAGYGFWYVEVEGKNTSGNPRRLVYAWNGQNLTGSVPQESDVQHIVNLESLPSGTWQQEIFSFYDDWTRKFSWNDTIESIKFVSGGEVNQYGLEATQKILLDEIYLLSGRFDHDAATVSIDCSLDQQGANLPKAAVGNVGAFPENFTVVCEIIKDGDTVYSDGKSVSLAVGEETDLTFKSYKGGGTVTVYTALDDDDNTTNDTLTKTLTAAGVSENGPNALEKMGGLIVKPTISSGMINIENVRQAVVYDVTGKEIKRFDGGTNNLVLKANGVYFIKSGNRVEKVLKIQ